LGKSVDKSGAGGVAADGFATEINGGSLQDRKRLKDAIRAAWLDRGGYDMATLVLDAEPNGSFPVAFAIDRDAVEVAGGRFLLKPIGQAFASARNKAGVIRGRFIVSADV
jgi:hypothetical protein